MTLLCGERDMELSSIHNGTIRTGNISVYIDTIPVRKTNYLFLLIAFFRYEVQHLHRNGGIVQNV